MERDNAIVIVPTVREDCIREFLRAWNFDASVRVLVIEDHPEPTFDLDAPPNVIHLSHADIERDLGASAWIVPRGTDCVRSYGFWRAWVESRNADPLCITLDDDCFPVGDTASFLRSHAEQLTRAGADHAWTNTLDGVFPRGVPYFRRERERRCVLNHGLWTCVPDLDAVTQLSRERIPLDFVPRQITLPRGMYFPMCGMNLGFRREVLPALYFLLMGDAYGVDRFGDIWSGIILKRICDHLGLAIRSGAPYVEHRRASNVWANLRKEAPGLEINEWFWQSVDDVRLRGQSFRECYREVANGLRLPGDYGQQLRRAMLEWSELFSEEQ